MGILPPDQVARIKGIGATKVQRVAIFKEQRGFTIPQLAKWWGWSDDFLRPYFKKKIGEGISAVTRPEVVFGDKPKRRYTSMRIPLHVAQKVYAELFPGNPVWYPPQENVPQENVA